MASAVEIGRQDVTFKHVHYRQAPVGGGRRAEITELSAASRRRMYRTVRNIPPMRYMITLTYPKYWPACGKTVKYHWQRLRQWLQTQGVDRGFWFLEFQKRGAPHFHVFLDSRVHPKELSKRWFEIVGTPYIEHLRAGTRFEALRSTEAASAYAAKYAVKDEQKTVPEEFRNVGRFWGLWGLRGGVWRTSDNWTPRQVHNVERVARKWAHANGITVNRSYRNPYSTFFYGLARPIWWAFSAGKLDKILNKSDTCRQPDLLGLYDDKLIRNRHAKKVAKYLLTHKLQYVKTPSLAEKIMIGYRQIKSIKCE